MGVDWSEVRRGLAETRPYLLSHHLPGRRDRCYRVSVRGRRVDVCARCSGIYPGIAFGLLAFLFAPPSVGRLWLIGLAPLPALVDWLRTALGDRSGSNVVRTATGALLGYAYGLGLGRLFGGGDLRVLGIGLGYVALTVFLLAAERRRS